MTKPPSFLLTRCRRAVLFSAALALLFGSTTSASAAVLFQDGFESGALGPAWSVAATNDGRATVTSNFAPATGTQHLVLDDAVNDVLYSVAEATLTLDFSNKKNIVVTFKAKSLGNEPHAPPTGNFTTTRAYDGVAISADGGATWRAVQSLANVGSSWETFSVALDSSVAALGGNFGAGFRIRFSEYDNAPAPIDGIAIDDVSVNGDDNQASLVEAPSPLIEGTGGQTGYVLLAYAPSTPLTLALTTSPAGALDIPATVTIPAGATSVAFDLAVPDDSVVNLTRTVAVYANAPDVTALPGYVTIYDDEAPIPTLTIPAQLSEGQSPSNNATLTLDRAPAVPLTMTLTADVADELIFPPTVTVPAGQTGVTFTVRANNDSRIDGNIPVTLRATAEGMMSASATTTTIDNETRTLSINAPATVQEDTSATITITIPGTLTAPLVVQIGGIDPAVASAPTSVTIPAGATSNSFSLTPVNNTILDGSRAVTINASASTFTGAAAVVTIRDDEVASFQITGLTDIVNLSAPVNITVSPIDIEGNVIAGRIGTLQLVLALPDGNMQPVSPSTVTLQANGSWTGPVTLPQTATPGLRIRATANNMSGDSRVFDIMRVLPTAARGLVWDAARSRIYASIPATASSPYANSVVAIDPITMQITASAPTGQSPATLFLTSGGEALYAALDANGTIARIDLPAFTIGQIFTIGVDPSYGTLYAEDMATVAGQPNVLVVSRYSKTTIPRHVGVVVFDNGVARPTVTSSHTGSNRIEPSADPNIFWGFNAESTEYGFRKLQVNASGITQIGLNTNLLSGYPIEIIAEGDRIASTSGALLDGPNLRKLGTFPASGPVRPELAANRVYFLEPQTPGTYNFVGPYDKLGAYEPGGFSRLARLNLPQAVPTADNLMRWGATGFAFRTDTSIVLINSAALVPNDPPADLVITVNAQPNPATAGQPLLYTLQVTNQGPNIAKNTGLNAVLSAFQTVQGTSASSGTPTVSGANVSLAIGDLAPGASVTLQITVTPQSAGSVSCTGVVSSTSVDLNYTNNIDARVLSAGYQTAPDSVNQLRLVANNLLYDNARDVLWATTPSTVDPPAGRALVSINPNTGIISDPFPLNGTPKENCIALAPNGRYLYVGLTDAPEVARIDLTTTPYTIVRVPLGVDYSSALYAQDIEVLEGDGTSFVMTSSNHYGAAAYDGVTRRGTSTGIYTADRIEKTSTPNVFISFQNYSSSYELRRLSITPTGVSSIQSAQGIFTGSYSEVKGAGDLLLSSGGRIANSNNLTLRTNLGLNGRPCLDLPNGRAYIVNGNALRQFDPNSGSLLGTFTLPVTNTGDWALGCVRWGIDGFAILALDKIYVARWSNTLPPETDSNGDYISDAWALANFGTINIDVTGDPDGDGIATAFEYFFNTLPLVSDANPVQVRTEISGGGNVLHLIFPRRAQMAPGSYGYETSPTLRQWTAAAGVTETILSTQLINGVQTQTIDAAIPIGAASRAFARLRWLGP